jgi:hypothetical protein
VDYGLSPLFICILPHFHVEVAVVLVAPALHTLSDQEIKDITKLQQPQRVRERTELRVRVRERVCRVMGLARRCNKGIKVV